MRVACKLQGLLRLSLALSALLLAACAVFAPLAPHATPAPGPRFPLTGQTGIQGRAVRVIRISADEYTALTPLQVTVLVLDQGENLVTRVPTDVDGYFSVNLPPGTYTLRLDTNEPMVIFPVVRVVMVQDNQMPYVELVEEIPLT